MEQVYDSRRIDANARVNVTASFTMLVLFFMCLLVR